MKLSDFYKIVSELKISIKKQHDELKTINPGFEKELIKMCDEIVHDVEEDCYEIKRKGGEKLRDLAAKIFEQEK